MPCWHFPLAFTCPNSASKDSNNTHEGQGGECLIKPLLCLNCKFGNLSFSISGSVVVLIVLCLGIKTFCAVCALCMFSYF